MYLHSQLAEPAAAPAVSPAIRQFAEQRRDALTRDCTGIRVLEWLDKFSPAERVVHWENVLRALPDFYRLKAELDRRVAARTLSDAQRASVIAQVLSQLGYPGGYAMGSLDDELVRARCKLGRARWELCAVCFGPGVARLFGRVLPGGGLGEPAASSACNPTLDATAQRIIAAAQNTSVPEDQRAVQVVRDILNTYYPGDVSKVADVRWQAGLNGLETQAVNGPTATGVIFVGRQFLQGTNATFFARRVLQVGHELRHIDQHRQNLGGPANKVKREFMAHCWTALAGELPGTGCLPATMRLAIIDCALRFYYCMSAADQSNFAAHLRNLLLLRAALKPSTTAPGAGGTCPPTGC
jgi:hypothetical protein